MKSKFTPLICPEDFPSELIDLMCAKLQPPLLARLDVPVFVSQLCAGLSLSLAEKLRALEAMPTLSQFQFDELRKVFSDEREEFGKLINKEWHQIANLSANNWFMVLQLAAEVGATVSAVQAMQWQTDVLKRKFNTSARQLRWLEPLEWANDDGNLAKFFDLHPALVIKRLPEVF